MQQIGAEVYVIAPQNWDEQGKKQVNDKLDAQVMCRRLGEYLAGHRRALSVVAIPTPEQEAARSEGRMRDQLRQEIRRLQAMGRSLLLQREMGVRGRWWNASTWEAISQRMPQWVLAQLKVWKKLIEVAEKEVLGWEKKIQAAAPKDRFLGEGALSHVLLERELLDPQRFKNSRQVSNYFGLCPSESSTSDNRRLGSITKHGNPRLRRLMVQLAWRVVGMQPQYRAVQKWKWVFGNPKASGALRKKAIVALARQLAVDRWRLATGRISAKALGLQVKGA
jgi:transposase